MFCFRYLTLRNGGIALAQAHVASLIIFVSQYHTLSFPSILNLTRTKYTKYTQTEDGQSFSEGSSICTTTLSATPSAMLRSAGDIQIIRMIEAKLLMHCKAKQSL